MDAYNSNPTDISIHALHEESDHIDSPPAAW